MAAQWQTDDRLRVWRMFLEAHTRLVRQLDRELRQRHRLPIEWYDVLVDLQEGGGRRTMGKLADDLLISPSNCSRLVDRMTAKGFVERKADESDGRVKHAVLTGSGFDTLREATPTHLAGVERYFTRLLDDDIDANMTLFARILDTLGSDPVDG